LEHAKAVNALLDMVMARYAIDKKRVAVTGYSMGGSGSWHWAEKFPESDASNRKQTAGSQCVP
jgi:predicted peptidase